MGDPTAVGLQLRLVDRFGDNGVICVVIGRALGDEFAIDTWLMSCSVLGRQVEACTLNLIAEQAKRLGCTKLVGEYRPTSKNGMVRTHYGKLGFTLLKESADGGSISVRDLNDFSPISNFIETVEG